MFIPVVVLIYVNFYKSHITHSGVYSDLGIGDNKNKNSYIY